MYRPYGQNASLYIKAGLIPSLSRAEGNTASSAGQLVMGLFEESSEMVNKCFALILTVGRLRRAPNPLRGLSKRLPETEETVEEVIQ